MTNFFSVVVLYHDLSEDNFWNPLGLLASDLGVCPSQGLRFNFSLMSIFVI